MVEFKPFKLTDDQRISNLYEILKSYAPDEKAFRMCQNVVSKVDTNNKEILLDLISILYDGLAYGNWPWTRKEVK